MLSSRGDLTEPLETLLRLVTEHEAYYQQHEVRIAELEHAISSVKHPVRPSPQVWNYDSFPLVRVDATLHENRLHSPPMTF
jgi:hypothetical protein